MKINKRDNKILALKEEIEKKRADLSKPKKNFLTNLMLNRTNLNILSLYELYEKFTILNSMKVIFEERDINPLIDGYPVDSWINDLQIKIDTLEYKEKELSLSNLERKLDSLMSEDYKKGSELDAIEKLLM